MRAPVGLVAALLVVRLADESLGFLREGAFESWRSDLGLTYREAAAVLVAAAPGAMVGSVFSTLADFRSRRVIASGGAFGFAASLLAFGLGRGFFALACRVVRARHRRDRDGARVRGRARRPCR